MYARPFEGGTRTHASTSSRIHFVALATVVWLIPAMVGAWCVDALLERPARVHSATFIDI